MRVLVTGGSGFIGRYVVEQLRDLGFEPLVLCRTQSSMIHGVHEQKLGDVRDYTAVSEAMAHVDGFIHLAGVLGTQETIADPWPAIDTNMHGMYNVLEAAAKYHLPGVNIAVGNWWMNNPYSITKNLAERLCLMYRDSRGVRVTVVRALNAYGPRQSIAAPYGSSKVRKITPSFVCRALLGDPIEVYGDGGQIMDMAYVEDVAGTLVQAFVKTMDHGPAPHVLEAGTGVRTSVLDIAQAVVKAAESSSEVVHVPMRPGEPEGSVVLADPDTLSWVHGAEPGYLPLDEGIALTVDWYRSHWLPAYSGR